MKQSRLRYWFKLTLFTLAVVGSGVGLLVLVIAPLHTADVMMYPARRPVCCQTPADFGLHYEDVAFPTSDGLTLRGWYLPGSNGATILFAHGGGGNRLSIGQLEQAAALAEQGFSILLYDLRSHGDSEGTQTSFTGVDVLAALNYLRSRPEVDPDRIGAIGLSLGAIDIVHAAADGGLKAIILDGLGQSGAADFPPPTTPAQLMIAGQRLVTFTVLRARGVVAAPVIDAMSKLPPQPKLFISGTGQDLEREAVRRYVAAASEPKSLWEIPEGSHAYTWAARPQEYTRRIVAFFTQSLLK
ncbi:hypothetical protein TFLX_03331 [Thermoflexales bacterium]|nr:hypothetical protein TFLX_03331 [Thermoflexales bacterium]